MAKKEETKKTFQATLFNEKDKQFLRTGDLGFIQRGELFITGRIKELIIIRGINYYPQDIELIVQKSHTQLQVNGGAVFSVEIESKEELVIFQEIKKISTKQIEWHEIISAIREAVLQEYEISVYAVYLLKRGHLPKTSSGKIQRNACRQIFLQNTVEAIASWTKEQISLGQGLPQTENDSMAYPERVELLVNQYWEFLKSLWQDNFGNVGEDAIGLFVEQGKEINNNKCEAIFEEGLVVLSVISLEYNGLIQSIQCNRIVTG
ncbi:AMP-binding protein [Spirulina sp. CS-785/01]|uniref:AMP-binding protein n=1 Tax=Spirulina sp. CS-785/01 TaxID=3021716 RepID=UPI00232B6347|nr:AMP-binding protein [Spirulina sp. CS-785/01]MDB9314972.1 AMP-binding protein [Spirulina sp. CS-785/01]